METLDLPVLDSPQDGSDSEQEAQLESMFICSGCWRVLHPDDAVQMRYDHTFCSIECRRSAPRLACRKYTRLSLVGLVAEAEACTPDVLGHLLKQRLGEKAYDEDEISSPSSSSVSSASSMAPDSFEDKHWLRGFVTWTVGWLRRGSDYSSPRIAPNSSDSGNFCRENSDLDADKHPPHTKPFRGRRRRYSVSQTDSTTGRTDSFASLASGEGTCQSSSPRPASKPCLRQSAEAADAGPRLASEALSTPEEGWWPLVRDGLNAVGAEYMPHAAYAEHVSDLSVVPSERLPHMPKGLGLGVSPPRRVSSVHHSDGMKENEMPPTLLNCSRSLHDLLSLTDSACRA